jgi:hypothetical protein
MNRVVIVAAVIALWVLGIETKLVYLQIYQHADLVARARPAGTRSRRRPSAATLSIAAAASLATSVDADTIYAVPGNRERRRRDRDICDALGDCDAKDRQSLVEKLGQHKAFAGATGRAGSGAARRRVESGRDRLHQEASVSTNKELAAHLLGWVGIDNTRLTASATPRSADPRQGRHHPVHTDARRHAFSRFERRRRRDQHRLTIDEYYGIAERELPTACSRTAPRQHRHHHEPAPARFSRWRTSRPSIERLPRLRRRRPAQPRGQDICEPGSTFKMVTASAAIEEKVLPLDSIIDVSGGQLHGSRVVRHARLRAVVHRRHRQVEQRRRDQDRLQGRHRPAEPMRALRVRTPCHDFPGESPGIVWRPDKWTDSALASVSMGYRVGVTRYELAAVSSVANGGQYVGRVIPRVARTTAATSSGRRYPPHDQRRHRGDDDRDHGRGRQRGTGRRRRFRLHDRGQDRHPAKLVNGHYSASDWNASFVGFVPSRDPAVAIIVVTDSPHNKGAPAAGLAPVFEIAGRRSYLGVGPDQSASPFSSPVTTRRRRAARQQAARSSASSRTDLRHVRICMA